ncbi:MAG: hypothetical protein WAN46_19545 [Gammaproteobacteria bacterium]|jgi:hypothetical protein
MRNYNRYAKRALGLALLVLLYSGCATIEKDNAMDMERTLAAAGFRMKTANTPEQRAHLQTLTQRKLVKHEKDGKPVWIYADATYCNCLYAGNEKAYQEYSKLSIQQQVAEENEDAAMDWGVWGAGPGWW